MVLETEYVGIFSVAVGAKGDAVNTLDSVPGAPLEVTQPLRVTDEAIVTLAVKESVVDVSPLTVKFPEVDGDVVRSAEYDCNIVGDGEMVTDEV